MAENPVQFVQIISLGEQFGVEASPDFPMQNRIAESEEALIGRMVRDISNLSDDAIVDVETLDHRHLTLLKQSAEQPAAPAV